MKELVEKVSSYNIFNYLFPGILYVAILKGIGGYDFLQDSNLLGLPLYYFIGLIVSRFGSLVVEPILKKASFIKFADYKDYITASAEDSKIELFSEVNNMYRTLISLIVVISISLLYQFIALKIGISQGVSITLLLIALFMMFIFSYKKQTGYIVKRVDTRTKDSNT